MGYPSNPNCGVIGDDPTQCSCDLRCEPCSQGISEHIISNNSTFKTVVHVGLASYELTFTLDCSTTIAGKVSGTQCQTNGDHCWKPNQIFEGTCDQSVAACKLTFKEAVKIKGPLSCSLGPITIGLETSLEVGQTTSKISKIPLAPYRFPMESGSDRMTCLKSADEALDICTKKKKGEMERAMAAVREHVANEVRGFLTCKDPSRLTPCTDDSECWQGKCVPVEGHAGKYCEYPIDGPTLERSCRAAGAYCTSGKSCEGYRCDYDRIGAPGTLNTLDYLCVDPNSKKNPLWVRGTCCILPGTDYKKACKR